MNLNDLNKRFKIWAVLVNLSQQALLNLGLVLNLSHVLVVIRMLKIQHIMNNLHYEKNRITNICRDGTVKRQHKM